MIVQERCSDKPITIESEYGITLTDSSGHRYEIKENKDHNGFEVLCDNGSLILRPNCSNVVYISANK